MDPFKTEDIPFMEVDKFNRFPYTDNRGKQPSFLMGFGVIIAINRYHYYPDPSRLITPTGLILGLRYLQAKYLTLNQKKDHWDIYDRNGLIVPPAKQLHQGYWESRPRRAKLAPSIASILVNNIKHSHQTILETALRGRWTEITTFIILHGHHLYDLTLYPNPQTTWAHLKSQVMAKSALAGDFLPQLEVLISTLLVRRRLEKENRLVGYAVFALMLHKLRVNLEYEHLELLKNDKFSEKPGLLSTLRQTEAFLNLLVSEIQISHGFTPSRELLFTALQIFQEFTLLKSLSPNYAAHMPLNLISNYDKLWSICRIVSIPFTIKHDDLYKIYQRHKRILSLPLARNAETSINLEPRIEEIP